MSYPKTDFDKIELWAFYGLRIKDQVSGGLMILPFKREGDKVFAAYFDVYSVVAKIIVLEQDWKELRESSYYKKGYHSWSKKAHEMIQKIFSPNVDLALAE